MVVVVAVVTPPGDGEEDCEEDPPGFLEREVEWSFGRLEAVGVEDWSDEEWSDDEWSDDGPDMPPRLPDELALVVVLPLLALRTVSPLTALIPLLIRLSAAVASLTVPVPAPLPVTVLVPLVLSVALWYAARSTGSRSTGSRSTGSRSTGSRSSRSFRANANLLRRLTCEILG